MEIATSRTQEEWRPTHDLDYWVSNHGRVISFTESDNGRYLKPGRMGAGYPTVVIRRGNTHLVHRLVAKAFLGPIPEGQEVRHKDDNRANPCLENLEYGTRRDNVMDMVSRGRWNGPRGALHRSVKLTAGQIPAIRELRQAGLSFMQIANFYEVSQGTIRAIFSGRSWAHVA